MLYFGASYGTKLGATYADLFPDKVGRMVLDGAVDLSIDSRQLSLEQAGGFEVALRSYVQNCVDEGDCFLGDTAGRRAEHDPGPDRRASTRSRCRPSCRPRARGGQRVLRPDRAALQPRLLADPRPGAADRAATATGRLLLRLADAYESRNDDGTYADNSAEAILAINCLDDPYSITADEVPAQIPAFKEASPTFGDVFAWGLVACHGVQAQVHRDGREIDGCGRRADRGRRHHPRPRDALPMGRAPRRPAAVRRAGQPRRRRAHRLQLGQRLRRRGGRGLPRRRHRAGGRAGVLEQAVSDGSWRRRTPPRSRAGGVADPSKTPSLRACRRLASPRLDDAGIHQQPSDTA